jgi:hypothetical protein
MKFVISILSVLFIFQSCTSNNSTQVEETPVSKGNVTGTLPQVNGKPGEVLVSIKNDLWKGEIKQVFDSVFSTPAKGPYIYQEHILDYIQEDPSVINKTRKKHRNFLRIVVDKEANLKSTEVQIKKNNYSNGQLYIQIRDSKKERLVDFLKNELLTYVLLFDEEETDRLVKKYKQNPHLLFKQTAENRFGISISIPQSSKFKADLQTIIYALDKSADEVTKDNPKTGAKGGTYWSQRGVLVWSSPYIGEESMNPKNIMSLRDSILKEYVKGTEKGSYMTTEYYPTHKPTLQYINVDGNEAVKIEGLWKQTGNPEALGGGPFVQYSIKHPTRNTVVHAQAHIFAPRFDKREYIRQIRAILKTIKVVS